jgi:glutamine synthetase
LGQALSLLEADDRAAEWLGPELLAAYVLFKRAELKGLEDIEEAEICRRYAEVY